MSREPAISHKEAAALGWSRVDPKPWGKLSARWTHQSGWRLEHCGHPTALRPWALYDPEGRMVLTGAEQEGDPSTDNTGTISRFKHGTAWWNLRTPMEWVAQEVAKASAEECSTCHAKPEQVYVCDLCGALVCSGCSESTAGVVNPNGVVCDRCIGEADRGSDV